MNEAISDSDIKSAMMKDVSRNNSLMLEETMQKTSIQVKRIHIDNVNLNNASPCIDKTAASHHFDNDLLKINNNKRNRFVRL